MCVVSISWKAHPRWQLLIAGNRDEFHARASQPLGRWNDRPDIIAGRDLVSAGTWMGVSEAGRFAVVTNIRDADGPDPSKKSRGMLVTDWLNDGRLPEAADRFNPFNLIVGDGKSLRHCTNRPAPMVQDLAPGIHGLSNAIINEHWPRTDRLDEVVKRWLGGAADRPDSLLDALSDRSLPDRDAYPLFIDSPVYGTRCSTVIAVDHEGQGYMVEQSFDADGTLVGEATERFRFG